MNPFSKINQKNILHFILILSFEICLYQLFFTKHYSSDCLFAFYNQKEIIQNYSLSGRPVSALFVLLLDFFEINLVRHQVCFTVISILMLSLSIFILTKTALSLKKEDSHFYTAFFTLSSVLIFNNIFSVEHFIFTINAPFHSLSMLLIALTIKIIVKDLSFVRFFLCLFTISCINLIYQGYGGLLIPLGAVFLMYINKDSLKRFFYSLFLLCTAYFFSLLLSVFYIKYLHPIFYGWISYRNPVILFSKIIENIKVLINQQYVIWVTHLNMLPKYFFILSIALIIILFFLSRKEAAFKFNSSFIMLAVILLSAVLLSFLPHLLSRDLWIVPRTIVGISAVPGIILLTILLIDQNNEVAKKIFVGGSILVYVIVLFSYTVRIESDHIRTNKMDDEYAKLIINEIASKEKKSDIVVSKIGFKFDKYPSWCYKGVICYGNLNISARAESWSFPALLRMNSGRNFEVVKMDSAVFEHFFKDKNWDSFSSEQVIVKNDTAYIAIF